MRHIATVVLLAGLVWTPFSLAQDGGEAAAKKAGCLKCHSVSADKAGPSFKKSAEKYKGQPDKLQAFLKSGKDKHPVVKSEADVKAISTYILSR